MRASEAQALVSAVQAPALDQNAKMQKPVLPTTTANFFESQRGIPPGKYTIQTITFTSRPIAEKEIKRLTDKGFEAFLIPSGKFLQVCVAGFENRIKASETLIKLRSLGLAPRDAYVRTMPQ